MNRNELEKYILETYRVKGDFPFDQYPLYEVFRHTDNGKWFGLLMNVEENRIGLVGNKLIDILNIKCDMETIDMLMYEKGYYPAYHMNKKHWISINLCEIEDENELEKLIDYSFELTKK